MAGFCVLVAAICFEAGFCQPSCHYGARVVWSLRQLPGVWPSLQAQHAQASLHGGARPLLSQLDGCVRTAQNVLTDPCGVRRGCGTQAIHSGPYTPHPTLAASTERPGVDSSHQGCSLSFLLPGLAILPRSRWSPGGCQSSACVSWFPRELWA